MSRPTCKLGRCPFCGAVVAMQPPREGQAGLILHAVTPCPPFMAKMAEFGLWVERPPEGEKFAVVATVKPAGGP